MNLRRTLAVLAGTASLAALLGVTAPSATAAPTWADADEATITPGVQTYTEGAQCTANFIFTDGADVFIGQAAHCSGLGAAPRPTGAWPSRTRWAPRSRSTARAVRARWSTTPG